VRSERFRPPVTLAGRYVELVPLDRAHAPALQQAARDPEVSRFLIHQVGPSVEAVAALLGMVLQRQSSGTDLAFTTRLRTTGAVVGMTRFLHIDPENDSVEIGGTFLDSAFWRTPLNTDAKLAMLRYAFDEGGAHRVWLQTDVRNERSQAAITRLGAVREGVLREDRRVPSGRYRTSIIFSILASEWPDVRRRLEASLERPWTDAAGRSGPR
jgi:N-acetyltransferase